MTSRARWAGALAAMLLLFASPPGAAFLDAFIVPGETVRVSVTPDGGVSAGSSDGASVDATGRFVAFASTAADLVPDDTNGWPDVFVRDLVDGTTTRVSLRSDGAEMYGHAHSPTLSADARHVFFFSSAHPRGVYAHDRVTGEARSVAVTADASALSAWGYAASADASVVVLEVRWKPLHVWTRASGAAEPLLLDGAPVKGFNVDVSGDGRLVVLSTREPLAPEDTDHDTDLYVIDRVTGTAKRLAEGSGGQQFLPSISADGRTVAFVALSSPVPHSPARHARDVVLVDVVTGAQDVLTDAATFFSRVTLSSDGRAIVFMTREATVARGAGGVHALTPGVYVWDRDAETVRLATPLDGPADVDVPDAALGFDLALSGNGRVLAYATARNHAPEDVDGDMDVFARLMTV